jgi:thiol-disulfide isomerase/thioredoxin
MKPNLFVITRRTTVLAGILLALLLTWVLFNRQIQRPLAIRMLLNSTIPREETFLDLAKQADDPVPFLERCWATGKVPHRRLVAAFLNSNATANPPWFARTEPLAVAAALDADESVRELALAVLAARHSSRLFDCARAQLKDLDPMLRLMGLDYLRKVDPQRAVPIVIPLLDDTDLRVVADAEVSLTRWSGQDYGVRARLAIPAPEGEHAGMVDPANVEVIRRGVERRKQWWQDHAREYPAAVSGSSADTLAADAGRSQAPDFELKDLAGHKVRLSDLRGKTVLINFWATWCSACLAEIPDLVGLQSKLGNQMAIVGVALDGVPDEEGEQETGGRSLKQIQAKVARAVKDRRINYPVLLDPHGSAGGQYDGNELPTTVILDTEGRVRRRFIGERSLKVFEAMVAEVQSPGSAGVSPAAVAPSRTGELADGTPALPGRSSPFQQWPWSGTHRVNDRSKEQGHASNDIERKENRYLEPGAPARLLSRSELGGWPPGPLSVCGCGWLMKAAISRAALVSIPGFCKNPRSLNQSANRSCQLPNGMPLR